MEEHHAEMETKRAEKEEVREKKKVFKEQRADKISEYRTQFLEKIGDKIEKISDDKLKRILGKLEGLYTKTEANTSLSDEQKETTLSKIIALQDLITEKLEETDLDIEALIN
jgi:molybdopterin converting factor small subunit